MRLHSRENLGGATFAPVASCQTDLAGVGDIAAADILGDGRAEVVVAPSSAGPQTDLVVLQKSDSTYQSLLLEEDAYHTLPTLVDLESDGDLDLVVRTSDSVGRRCINPGDGLVPGSGQAMGYPASGDPIEPWRDLDDDGFVDILSINRFAHSASLSRGSPAGFLVRRRVDDASEGGVVLAVADFDGGVAFDLAVSSRPYGQLLLFDGPDVDGDGDLDLLAGFAGAPALRLLLGDGAGAFVEAPLSDAGLETVTALALTDLNGDGRADAAVAGEVLAVLFAGAEGFAGPPRLVDGSTGPFSCLLAVDSSGDGLPELLSSASSGRGLRVYDNLEDDGAGR